jgi:hypothetical protein
MLKKGENIALDADITTRQASNDEQYLDVEEVQTRIQAMASGVMTDIGASKPGLQADYVYVDSPAAEVQEFKQWLRKSRTEIDSKNLAHLRKLLVDFGKKDAKNLFMDPWARADGFETFADEVLQVVATVQSPSSVLRKINMALVGLLYDNVEKMRLA